MDLPRPLLDFHREFMTQNLPMNALSALDAQINKLGITKTEFYN
jgi:hypothetical protein